MIIKKNDYIQGCTDKNFLLQLSIWNIYWKTKSIDTLVSDITASGDDLSPGASFTNISIYVIYMCTLTYQMWECKDIKQQARGNETERETSITNRNGEKELWHHMNHHFSISISICKTCISQGINSLRRDKMAAFPQMIISNAFLSIKIVVFWLKFHWNLFPNGSINNIP